MNLRLSNQRSRDIKVGFTCGCFDILHYGYILMFRECKKHCDVLVVGLSTIQRPDKDQKIINPLRARMEVLKSVREIDDVVVIEGPEDLEKVLKEMKPDVRFVGADYKEKPFDSKELCEELNIKIHINSRDHDYSTSNLKKKLRIGWEQRPRCS